MLALKSTPVGTQLDQLNRATGARALVAAVRERNCALLARGEELFDFVPTLAPFYGGDVKATLSIPQFRENFDFEAGKLKDEELNQALLEALATLKVPAPT